MYQNEEINYHRTDKEALAGGDVINTRGKACEMEQSMIEGLVLGDQIKRSMFSDPDDKT